jgi:hypothetical protein
LLAEVVLTPSEGKRLIAKAIVHMPVVQMAKENGTIIVATSTTNAYVLEELTGKEVKDKGMFTAGVVTNEGLQITEAKGRHDPYVIEKGKARTTKLSEFPDLLKGMGPGDVFIKGANAIDPFGQAGILLGGISGGTIGASWGYLTSNGITTIIAAGLEKLVPINLSDTVMRMGIKKVDLALDVKCGMMVIQGFIITEMEAFKELFGIDVVPIGGGGIDGAEGSKIFLLDGEEEPVKDAVELVKAIRGEPKLTTHIIKQR